MSILSLAPNVPRSSRSARACFLVTLVILTSSLSGCAAGFVMRAGYEEAKILLGKESIEEILDDSEFDKETKTKLALVTEAKDYALAHGLDPKGSFASYTDIGREHLVWVLSAAPARSIQPKTWWFPIVGSLPYRGYFDKENGEEEAKRLEENGWDTRLRHSPAFSTLGWFEDPLLNTTLANHPVSVIDTVFHEIFHNNYWLKNHAQFNESVANFAGGVLAREFFSERNTRLASSERLKFLESVTKDSKGRQRSFAKTANSRFKGSIRYSEFIRSAVPRIEAFYKETSELSLDELKPKKLELFEDLSREKKEKWGLSGSDLKPNNALLVSHRTYYRGLLDICRLYEHAGQDIGEFINLLNTKLGLKEAEDPFKALATYLDGVESECPFAPDLPSASPNSNLPTDKP